LKRATRARCARPTSRSLDDELRNALRIFLAGEHEQQVAGAPFFVSVITMCASMAPSSSARESAWAAVSPARRRGSPQSGRPGRTRGARGERRSARDLDDEEVRAVGELHRPRAYSRARTTDAAAGQTAAREREHREPRGPSRLPVGLLRERDFLGVEDEVQTGAGTRRAVEKVTFPEPTSGP